jgi:hypothetical protein
MNKQITRQKSKQNRSSNKQGSSQNATQSRAPGKAISNKPVSHQAQKLDRRKEEQMRREEERRRQARSSRTTLISIISAIVLAAIIIGVVFYMTTRSSSTETVVNPNYPPVDGISCHKGEQTGFHIHAHLTLYVNGQQVPVSQGVGIAPDNSCLYWLHTHDSTGVIHIEAPADHSFTLKNFLNIWGNRFSNLNYPEPLDANVTQGWTVYVNGKPYTGDFHSIPLKAHTLITLGYNSPNMKPDTTYSWGNL